MNFHQVGGIPSQHPSNMTAGYIPATQSWLAFSSIIARLHCRPHKCQGTVVWSWPQWNLTKAYSANDDTSFNNNNNDNNNNSNNNSDDNNFIRHFYSISSVKILTPQLTIKSKSEINLITTFFRSNFGAICST